jgi:sugar phosphate isomerase/epimerase
MKLSFKPKLGMITVGDIEAKEQKRDYVNIINRIEDFNIELINRGTKTNEDEIFSILKETQFQGWVSIEDGMNGMDEMKESMLFLKMMRKKYDI